MRDCSGRAVHAPEEEDRRVGSPALSSLLNGKADLSGEMALRIEKAFGPKMDMLMRIQSAFDIARTRKRQSKIRVRRYQRAIVAA